MKRVDELPVVLTSFAYRREYFGELDGMLATIRKHHPKWSVVVGRGPVEEYELPTLEVDSPAGKQFWTLPVPLDLDGSVHDWRKITKMKAWWMAKVWQHLDAIGNLYRRQLIWIDADARLNGPLDIELEEDAEVVAGPWWSDPRYPGYSTIASGFLLFQGIRRGTVEAILEQWSSLCVNHIQKLPDPPIVPWFDGDQEVLNEVLQSFNASDANYTSLKLERYKYCGIVDKDGVPVPGALVDQWVMARKMKWPKDRERNWPPPEAARRPAVK
jgi:hypothetical protein